MPLDDLAEGFFRGLFRFLVSILVEVVIEILIKGPGYFMVKACSSNSPDSDSLRVVLVGILFWVLITIGGFSLYHQLTSQV